MPDIGAPQNIFHWTGAYVFQVSRLCFMQLQRARVVIPVLHLAMLL
jgi:hypothetical protein